MMDTLFLTPTELARRWRVTTDHLYREVLGRGLPAVRIGNGPRSRWRISLADIEAYESTHRVTYDGHAA
jgi:excisionase family DNA binding protein